MYDDGILTRDRLLTTPECALVHLSSNPSNPILLFEMCHNVRAVLVQKRPTERRSYFVPDN